MNKTLKIKILPTNDGQWYFKIIARNGRTLCHSESYKKLRSAIHAARVIREAKLYNIVEMG